MKPVSKPQPLVPPLPTWKAVPVPETTEPAKQHTSDIPVLEPVEPAKRSAEIPVLEVVEPTKRPEPMAVVKVVRDPEPKKVEKSPNRKRSPREHWFDNLIRQVDTSSEILLGIVCMPLGLAILSSIPLLNFIALGYLLEAGARIARSGKLRDGFFGIRRAGRVGGLFVGIWLTLIPVGLVTSMAQSAELIDPTSQVAKQWYYGSIAATVFAVIHIALACLWGGKLRHFLLPMLHPVFAYLSFTRCNPLVRARDGVWTFFVEAQPWYFFWLGLRGGLGALLWLALPISLLAVGWKVPILGFLGFFALLPVLVILPFLQMNFARHNDLSKMFDVRAVLRMYVRAPWACSLALFITFLFALPLYLLKIQFVPRDVLFLPAIVFIAFIWPARLLVGWVCAFAERRRERRHWVFIISAAIPILAVVFVYGFFVWLSQYLSWNGVVSLYEQHPFLLPVPFTGL